MDGIAEFSILDGKTESTILDGKRENGQLIAVKNLSNSFTFIGFTIMFLQFVWENGWLQLLWWKWSTFLSQNERLRSLTRLGHIGSIPVVNQSIKEHNQLISSWQIMIVNNAVRDRCSRYVRPSLCQSWVSSSSEMWYLHTAQLNVSSVYLCSRPICKNVLIVQHKLSGNVKTC